MAERRQTTSPTPLPAHPKQAELIAQQQEPERIDPPKVKFKSTFVENQTNDDPLLNTSPVSNLNVDKKENRQPEHQPTRREELIGATYLKKILSKEIISPTTNVAYKNAPAQSSANEVPLCCYAPPYINYVNGCKEIKVCFQQD